MVSSLYSFRYQVDGVGEECPQSLRRLAPQTDSLMAEKGNELGIFG